MENLRLRGGLRVVRESCLEWQIWLVEDPPMLIVGPERWAQLVWLTVKPGVLETDPGPLDAKVP